MDLTTFYIQFRDETTENLRVINAGLLALEANTLATDEHNQMIDAIFRAMHTIKGSGRMLGLDEIGRLAHTCENVLGAVRDGRRALDRELANQLLLSGDAIQEMVSALIDGRPHQANIAPLLQALEPATAAPATTPAPATPAEALPPPKVAPPASEAPSDTLPAARVRRVDARQTVRVRVDRLDRLLNLAGDLKIDTQTEALHLQTLTEIERNSRLQLRALVGLENELRRMRFSPTQRENINRHLNAAMNASEWTSTRMHTVVEQFSQHANQTTQIVEDLEQEVMTARLLPISTLYSNLPRAVRTLADELQKDVNLVLEGETTELDRKAIEALNEPLTHLVRNAIDHGLEHGDEREKAGKARQGTLSIEARALGAFVQIIIHDDGRGMDPERLRATAVRKGLITTDVAGALTDQE
ncbi:MAG TPA: Hpt domain-containing protein, partial [Roseiflexaceae bacterium]|nr:Hpt domain-containing protein [Roseiflexaceae bacterium]